MKISRYLRAYTLLAIALLMLLLAGFHFLVLPSVIRAQVAIHDKSLNEQLASVDCKLESIDRKLDLLIEIESRTKEK